MSGLAAGQAWRCFAGEERRQASLSILSACKSIAPIVQSTVVVQLGGWLKNRALCWLRWPERMVGGETGFDEITRG
jgi:hypothetical protein